MPTDQQLRERYAKSIQYITDYNAKRYRKAMDLANELRMNPCVDCGFVPEVPSQMDFDHVRGEKKTSVSRSALWGPKTLLAEIEKCDLVCANCHRLRTAKRKAGTENAEV